MATGLGTVAGETAPAPRAGLTIPPDSTSTNIIAIKASPIRMGEWYTSLPTSTMPVGQNTWVRHETICPSRIMSTRRRARAPGLENLMNYRIRRPVAMLLSIVTLILLSVAMASADGPGPPKPTRTPKKYSPPTPASRPSPAPVESVDNSTTGVTGTSGTSPQTRFWVRTFFRTSIVLLLIVLIWVLWRRKPKQISYSPPSRPAVGPYNEPV